MKNRRVAVFGCGPAGLMAAHTSRMLGYEPTIFSRLKPSDLYGCQYLHAPIPGLTVRTPVIVSYDRIGTSEQYRRKVYGEAWNGSVSTESLDREHAAWDIREAYKQLWDMYYDCVEDNNIDREWLEGFPYDDFAYTFSSIPIKSLCENTSHTFDAMYIHAFGETPTRKIELDDHAIGGNHVLCNGLDNPSWYRVSNVFGFSTIEWPWRSTPPVEGFSTVAKPLGNTCTCYPEMIRIGRYGRWMKGILTHHAVEQVWEVLK